MHMTANRLGLRNQEEVYLGRILGEQRLTSPAQNLSFGRRRAPNSLAMEEEGCVISSTWPGKKYFLASLSGGKNSFIWDDERPLLKPDCRPSGSDI